MTNQTTLRSTPSGERILAPDLARGFALLLVALAHATIIFLGNTPGVDQTPHGLEQPFYLVMFVFVHACALPLFGMLLGYGLVQFRSRQEALGVPWQRTRAVLLRRHAWMLVFGVVDGILFFSGDVLGGYSIVGIVMTLLILRRGNGFFRLAPTYLILATGYLAVLMYLVVDGAAGHAGPGAPVPSPSDASFHAESYGDAVRQRLVEYPITTAIIVATILFVFVGAWAARHRVLEDPERHVRLLRFGLVGGFGIGIAGALPMGLIAGDYLQVDGSTADLAKSLYEGAGLCSAVGYISLFGLVALARQRRAANARRHVVSDAVAALGQRTLSGYLFQSVAWLVLAPSFTLGLSGADSTLAAVLSAVGVWVLSVLGAYVMHRRGYRGPMEILLRRLAYRTPREEPAPAAGARQDRRV